MLQVSGIDVNYPHHLSHLGLQLHVASQYGRNVNILHSGLVDRSQPGYLDSAGEGGSARDDFVQPTSLSAGCVCANGDDQVKKQLT